MDSRTVRIIVLCKDRPGYSTLGLADCGKQRSVDYKALLRKYLAEECNCSESDYTERDLESVVNEAVRDYLQSGGNALELFNNFVEAHRYLEDLKECICEAFHRTRVCRWYGASGPRTYVNGFTEESLQEAVDFIHANLPSESVNAKLGILGE